MMMMMTDILCTKTTTLTCLLIFVQGGSAEVSLETGKVLKVSIEDKFKECGDENTIYVDYTNIVKVLNSGDLVYVDDGLISLKVTEKFPTHLVTGQSPPTLLYR